MAVRVKNISEGFVDGNGVFHPIRSAADYKPKRTGEKRKYATGKKRKPSKAKKTVTVAHVRTKARKTVAQLKAMLAPKRRVTRKNPVSRGVLEIHDAQKQLTLYDSIKVGKSVTVRTRQGTTRSGRATMRGSTGWVLTPKTHTGNPPIAYPGNIVSVRAGKLPVAKNPLPVGKYVKAKVKRMANGDVKVMISR